MRLDIQLTGYPIKIGPAELKRKLISSYFSVVLSIALVLFLLGLLGMLVLNAKKVSDHFGYDILPPEAFVNSLGYGFMNPDKFDLAYAALQMNIENYPNSSNVYDSMGDYYLATKDSVKALELFTKALEVGPNTFSQEKIDMLNESLIKTKF